MVASQAQVVIKENNKICDTLDTWGDNLLLILLLLLKLLQYFLFPTHKLGPALCFAAGPAGEGLVEEKAKGQQLDKHWICGWHFFSFTSKIWTKVLKIWCDEKRVVRNVLWYSILFFCWLTHFRELLLFEKSNKGSLRSFKLCAGWNVKSKER